jgi:hypothetical protein
MREYRKALHPSGEEAIAAEATHSTGDMPKYMSLAAHYGLPEDMDIGNSSGQEQTLEQEYQAYVMAPLVANQMNILHFWEVSLRLR